MTAYAIFDVEIYDMKRYGEYMARVQPALEAAGGRYLSRGGEHKVYEGDWLPRRLVLVEFPSVADLESFYYGPVYAEFKSLRDDCSSGRLVGVGVCSFPLVSFRGEEPLFTLSRRSNRHIWVCCVSPLWWKQTCRNVGFRLGRDISLPFNSAPNRSILV